MMDLDDISDEQLMRMVTLVMAIFAAPLGDVYSVAASFASYIETGNDPQTGRPPR